MDNVAFATYKKIEKCYTFLCKVKVVIPGFNHQTKYKSMKEAVGGIL